MLHRNAFKYSTAIFAVLMLTGCAELNSIHRHGHLTQTGQIDFIDAKQRGVFVIPEHKYVHELTKNANGKLVKKLDKNGNYIPIISSTSYKMCSEPAPDVFSVYANSAAAKVAAQKGEGFNGSFGMSSAEAGATIERTQVIIMLRESMFRTCERYMNGALDATQMNIQTARDQRMMVATLAIEQLTGVVKRRPTILTSQATTIIADSGKDIIEKIAAAEADVKKYEKEVVAAKAVKSTADAEYEALNKKIEGAPVDADKFCDVAIKAEADQVKIAAGEALAKPTTSTATAEELAACKSKKEAASSAASDLAGKEAKLTEAKNEVSKQNKFLEHLRDTVLTASAAGTGDAGSNPSSPQSLEAVANVVGDIAEMAFDDHSELSFACAEIIKNRFKLGAGTPEDEDIEALAACVRLIDVEVKNVETKAVDNFNKKYGLNNPFLQPSTIKLRDEVRDIAQNLAGFKARQLLQSPPVPIDAFTDDVVDSMLAGRSKASLPDADAKAILDVMINLNQDASQEAYAKWLASFK